jgi:hypothetical protein
LAPRVKVYLECGAKRTFASALDWPGWCRQGPDEAAALTALLAFGPRYASILARTRLGFVAPDDPGSWQSSSAFPVPRRPTSGLRA